MGLRILHIINNLGSGGAEKLLSDILPLFNKEGHEVSVMICNSRKSVLKYHKKLEDGGVRIINLNASFYNIFQTISIIKYVNKGNYHIVHAHLFPTQYWLALSSLFFKKPVKLIKTEHSVFNERKQYRILRPIEKFIYNRYDRIVAISDRVRENLEQWLGSDEVVVIQNGVNLSEIRTAKENVDLTQYPFLDPSKFNILMTGRFDGIHKDQKTLIEAVSLLDENIQLYFAGDGPALETMKQFAAHTLNNQGVKFLGMRTDIYGLMSLVDLNVLSTNTEGLSGVTLESLASGNPFLGSDVEGVREIVPDDSYLFPKQNPQVLAAKIKQLQHNNDRGIEMTSKALKHVQKYDLSEMVSKYLDLYISTVEK